MENQMENQMENHIEIEEDAKTNEDAAVTDTEPEEAAETPESDAEGREAVSKDEACKDESTEDESAQEAEAGPDEEAADAESKEGSQKSAEKKGFFKKNKKKDKKDEKIEELTDQVKRQMAEFDNFRKRTEKEKSQMYEIGAKSIIEKVLPVVDNFERGLAAVPEADKDDAFVDGMNKIYKQMMTMLEEAEVKPIEAVGKEFDPNLHNAVMQTESEEYESGIVAQELQKGYTYRDSVVRHSMVAVVS